MLGLELISGHHEGWLLAPVLQPLINLPLVTSPPNLCKFVASRLPP